MRTRSTTSSRKALSSRPPKRKREYRKANEKIKIDYIGFSPAKVMADIKPTPEELNAYFAKNKGFYKIPETRNLQLIVADQAKVADTIQVTDAQVQAYYNAHKDEYRTPERVRARHILLSTANKPKDEVPKIQAQAEALDKQLKAGADFAELAKKNSQDPGSAAKGRGSGLGFPGPDGQALRRRRLHAEAERDQQRCYHRIRLPYHSSAGEAAGAPADTG